MKNFEAKLISCDEKDKEYICDRLVEYNLSQVPKRQDIAFEDISLKAVDTDGRIIGGILAKMYCWNVVYVDILWVDESCRNQGLGSFLLKEAERISRAKNATLIHLDTFDFQAEDFYLKQGYELFGMLEDCPKGHTRYYLKKSLEC